MQLEWLETNGLGGYACGTLLGIRTRRYHGWLVAALSPPTQRTLLWAGCDEMVVQGQQTVALSAHLFRGNILATPANASLQLPDEFVLDWCPQWRWELPSATIVKRLFMPYLRNACVVRYFVRAKEPVTLQVRLFAAWRDHHWTMQPVVPLTVSPTPHGFALLSPEHTSRPLCHFAHNGDAFVPLNEWWHNFWLPIETERGLDDTESLFCVGTIVKGFDGDGHLDVVAAVEPCDVGEVPFWEAAEQQRRKRWRSDDDLTSLLQRAADDFIAVRSSIGTRTVIAGYPWFTDWGRDALIALPGLTLVTRRFAIARDILLTFARSLSDGMVPNFFPEAGEQPAYNTVDATLWFVLAVYRYLRYTRDSETVRRHFWEPLREILRWHLHGTRYGIGADPEDGLLRWDAAGEALTWMDAKVWGTPVTPRTGKPVEVNALWCNALMLLARLAKKVRDSETEKLATKWGQKALSHFALAFWNAESGGLFDVIAPDGTPDPSIRCNQLLPLALPFRLLPPEKERSILRLVEGELLTPCGLRTLSPNDARYRGQCVGAPEQRDAAYHQGTVWAWWWGPFADAVALVEGEQAVREKVAPMLSAFLRSHLRKACVGQVSEIFDGAPPYQPRGCFAQAWSVAEILRAWVERVKGNLPPPLWDER